MVKLIGPLLAPTVLFMPTVNASAAPGAIDALSPSTRKKPVGTVSADVVSAMFPVFDTVKV